MNHLYYAFVAIVACISMLHASVPCPSRCRSCDNGVAECSMRSLTAPPRVYPEGTRIINLEGNHIRVIAERTFGNLDSAEVLKISGNKIVALRNDAFSPFPNLIILDLVDNRISRISRRTFNDLSKLRTLSLNRNKIDSMDGIFQHIPNLYQLNMANNRLTAIGQNDLSPMSRVHYLDFRDNLITSIHSQAFKDLINLRYVFLNNNPLVSTPRFEFGSQVLQLVDFSNCLLTAVPGPMPSSVTDLRLGHNKIMQVNGSDFLNITDLQLLALNDNELHFLADGALSHLTQLQEVWLRNNNLVYIPRGIPNNIRKVYMDSNNIQQIEVGLFSNLSHLDYLTVESNQIKRIQPDTFKGLRFLNTLNFQGNRVEKLEPGVFAELGSLSTLLLSSNPLMQIEDGAFRNLVNLTHLFLSYIIEENFYLDGDFLPEMRRLQTLHLVNSPGLTNQLMARINNSATPLVPLDNLTHLDVSYNTLEWVSPRIREIFPNLLSLPLDGNPLHCSHRLKWLRDWMLTSDVSFHNFDEIVCETPPRLKGQPLRGIEDTDWASDEEKDSQNVGVPPGVRKEDRRQLDNNGEEKQLNNNGDEKVQEGKKRQTSSPAIAQPFRDQGDRQGIDKRSHDVKERRRGKAGGKGKGEKGKKQDKKNKKDKNKKDKKKKKKEKAVTAVPVQT